MKFCFVLAASAAFALSLQGCGGGAAGPTLAQSAVVTAPANEQWQLATPAEVGMDGAVLQRALADLPASGEHGLASMLVLRHGKPIFEHYWNGYGKDTLHDLRSATKSITSLMVGIAIDKGMLGGLDEPISKYLAAPYPQAPALQYNIALEHLLTMRSGLECNDFVASSPGKEERMYVTQDWVRFFLDLPKAHDPGGPATYCTGGVVTLGRIIAEGSKRSIPDFAEAHLFGPLGVTGARWADFDNHRQTDTGGHLQLRPRDMARIGQLVLQGGKWNGVQLVSQAWIDQSTRQRVKYANGAPYGYLWWVGSVPYKDRKVEVRYADGNGGQFIFVVPELDLVAVFTGENYNNVQMSNRAFAILEENIIGAVLQ